ncbi:Uncharacterised protein [Serratia ficaria]|uniref:DUF5405 family protein n=1 Tax=Serratia ficaria TaxID=61651 RepID=UPI00217C6BA2|nr:DUF5405 family protein [Serratia ficaria]CAI1109893.1 Uncharacterised protein [Serratia ficaria]CAI1149847.1 Uncharacterised protein [Serratia ficaria]CAI1812876.1 Uncharacterised protein [Serratia ficaria]CAI2008602.1 Uncharacterised protein [Serratia ficaria]CAI2468001.1 Uncharacterised protein [Serratia ficaria]
MLRIAIGKEWVITSDAHQFILNQKKQVKSGAKAGEEWLDAVGYYPTISQLVNGLIHHHVRSSTANSMAGLAAEIGRIGQLCQEAFSAVRAQDK